MTQTTSNSREGLQFFGRISASVSHEIKNVFAVINESAGLIEDFTLMADRGMPIQPDRLKSAANSIQGQVRRGDTIIKNMNAFAHSTDEAVRELDLVEALDLTVALTTRIADMKQIRLTSGDCQAVSLVTNPFDLTRLLHSSIVAALDCMQAGDTLVIGLKSVSGGASFSLSAPGKDAPLKNDESFSPLAQAMNASVTVDEDTGTSELRVLAATGSK
ncbi:MULTISPECIES: HAMP domain-containing histidine kinase [unclassified Pseudodesulfovibrio]|uniref:HAMP domain-containing histidine kinase n=1 Tax=unclassified Pseudodesulfovibrio TaxID=2661612 RepID=UPI000FEBB3B5|nr:MULTISPECIES: HAMP domain-containing histidine kinase [unclassified Pseudodesulfovibrio]MCJ2163102.1 HAMP domain-containing histidine kinase [Pseudodesulfovibrio sp. S3-i]RWU07094.1 sensor histidine kinase [Pseudodesulfovibrio sp. S3]